MSSRADRPTADTNPAPDVEMVRREPHGDPASETPDHVESHPPGRADDASRAAAGRADDRAPAAGRVEDRVPAGDPATDAVDTRAEPTRGPVRNMLPGRERRRFGVERILVRIIATCGVIGIGVALGAILVSSHVEGWITGLVVSIVSVVLSAVLWSSRQL